MIAIAKHLRRAWLVLPEDAATYDGVSRFLQRDNWRSEDERRKVQRNPNKEDVDSAWRKAIYFYWNHIFFDVMNFLAHAQSDVGHFHAPNAKKLVLEYPKSKTTYRKKWSTNMIATPAFLDNDVSVRFETAPSSRANEPWGLLGVFDSANSNEIWYIRKDLEVDIHIEVDAKNKSHGVAAVLVYAALCTDEHQATSQNPPGQNTGWKDRGKELQLSRP